MNQQEIFSGEQDLPPQESEIQAQPYYWSTRPKAKTGDMPKNEHPSTYEESILSYSYRAQEGASYTSHRENPTYRANARQSNSDGDTFERGYRPYTAYYMQWQVPPWARPQHNNGKGLRTVIFVVLGLMLVVPLLKIVAFLLAGIGILLGIAVFTIVLLPLVIAFLAVFAAMTLMVLAWFGIRPWRFRERAFRPRRGGFWGW